MTKRAVVVGVNQYPLPADTLEAPVKEAGNWAQLLSFEYGFGQNVVTKFDTDAVRLSVLNELRSQLSLAAEGDITVLVLCGHSAETRGWESDDQTNNRKELAFISYLESSAQGFQEAAITPSDVVRILRETAPPSNSWFITVGDFCHSEKFAQGIGTINPSAPPEQDPKVLFIPGAVQGLPAGPALTFADMPAMLADRTLPTPLFLAASLADQPAQEVGDPSNRRLLFSREAIQRLRLAYATGAPISSKTLIDEINPLGQHQSATYFPQSDPGPAHYNFAGGLRTRGRAPSIAAEAFSPAAVRTAAPAGSLDVRIFGLVTLTNLPAPFRPYRNRFVFPLDTYATTPAATHRAFLEVADRDLLQPPAVPPTREYLRAGVKYSSWLFTEHIVTIPNAFDNGSPIDRSTEYKKHVPKLPEVTPKELDPNAPRHECFYDFVLPQYFSGFFDVQSGSITIGELEKHKTEFKLRYSQKPTRPAEYTPISVHLNVPLQHDHAVIVMAGPRNSISAIFVKSGSEIRVGNARDADIFGPGSGEGPSEHFLIYYNLAPQMPLDPGLPQRVQVPINACTVTDWP